MEPIYERFGRELRRIRRERRLTQAQLAERLRLGRTSVVNIEKGTQRVHLHTVYDLAEALGVDPAALLPTQLQAMPELEEKVRHLPPSERAWVFEVLADASGGTDDRPDE